MDAEDFHRGLPVEDLAGPVVERESDGFKILGGPAGQVGSLREVLTEQPVGVLVRRPLSYDNALPDTTNGLFKTELHRNPAVLTANGGPWKGLDDLELATARWVGWFNDERLHSELEYRTPAEAEAEHYAHQSQPDAA